jgi:hypothetical protein
MNNAANFSETLGSLMLRNPGESYRAYAVMAGRPCDAVKADLERFVQYGNATRHGAQYELTARGKRLAAL